MGVVDQPPLTPLLARAAVALLGDTVWALRVPAALCAGGFVLLVALIARELGGGPAAQSLAAAGLATSALPLIVGHTMVTATVDLVTWTAVILCAARALLRDDGRWWLGVGVVAGLALYNKHLIALLGIGLVVGLAVAGPRRVFADRRLWFGVGLALVLGAPNLWYQATHGWPQLTMARALARSDGPDNRATFLPLQLLLIGPTLMPVWAAGLVALFREPRWRPLRALAVAYPAAGVVTVVAGGRPDYVFGLLAFLFAAGCVRVEWWLAARRARRRALGPAAALVGAVLVNAVLDVVIALPVIPVDTLARTPVPAINEVARESVGWPEFAAQVAGVYAGLPPADRARAVLLTGNYGEAGALDRYRRRYRLPAVYSGQNELVLPGPAAGVGHRGGGGRRGRCVVAAVVRRLHRSAPYRQRPPRGERGAGAARARLPGSARDVAGAVAPVPALRLSCPQASRFDAPWCRGGLELRPCAGEHHRA